MPPTHPQNSQRWIRNLATPSPLRLICFPHAGGGAAAYRNWVIPGVAVCPIVLPGHEDRLGETPLNRLTDLVREISLALLAAHDRPFAFFGHSMGALLAFETARSLRREGRGGPVHLFVSGHEAPDLPEDDEPRHLLPDDALMAHLYDLGGTPAEVLAERELMELLLPTIRADYAVCETRVHREEPPLATPLTVLAGRLDDIAQEELDAWWRHSEHPAGLHWFDGGHFYTQEHPREVCAVIAETLAKVPFSGVTMRP